MVISFYYSFPFAYHRFSDIAIKQMFFHAGAFPTLPDFHSLIILKVSTILFKALSQRLGSLCIKPLFSRLSARGNHLKPVYNFRCLFLYQKKCNLRLHSNSAYGIKHLEAMPFG
jgi:hypothetical protein